MKLKRKPTAQDEKLFQELQAKANELTLQSFEENPDLFENEDDEVNLRDYFLKVLMEEAGLI